MKKAMSGDEKSYKKFIDKYNTYSEFYQNFIEFSTGKPYSYYELEYFLNAKDASMEELHELTGIMVDEGRSSKIFCIPRDSKNDKLFDYIVENVPCEFKILKKINGTYCDYGPETYVRDTFKTSDKIRNELKEHQEIKKINN